MVKQSARDFLTPQTRAGWVKMTALLCFVAGCLLTVSLYRLTGPGLIPTFVFAAASIGLAARRGVLLRRGRSSEWSATDAALWITHQVSGALALLVN